MSVESFEKVLQKIKGHGAYVYLHIKGEPLLHPDLPAILVLCQAYDVKVNITTNGTLLDKYGNLLLTSKAVRQVSISLQSFEGMDDGLLLETSKNATVKNEDHNEIDDAFEIYMNRVLSFVNKGRLTTEIYFELRLWNYEEAIDADHNQRILDMIKASLELTHTPSNILSSGRGNQLCPRVYLSKDSKFQWPDLQLPVISTKGTCYGLRQQVGILVSGDVVPCCLDSEGDVNLGNLFEETFENIVTSSRSEAIVKGFEEYRIVEALCSRCGYRGKFDTTI
jgi:radical SAM protein with 4Fe4S-binding SPASM domain